MARPKGSLNKVTTEIKEKLKKSNLDVLTNENDFLVKSIDRLVEGLELIDDYGIDGDFVESQAFAYLAIRSFLKLPISFPETTGVNKPCTGGIIIK